MRQTRKVEVSYTGVKTKVFKSIAIQTDSPAKNPTEFVFLSNDTINPSKNQSSKPKPSVT